MNTTPAIILESGETIVHTVRRHWFHIVIVGIFDVGVFAFVGIMLSIIGIPLLHAYMDAAHLSLVGVFLLALIALMLWIHFFTAWTDHWLDAWIITNKRIIDIEQKGFFHREVSSFPLDRIEDVTHTIDGVFAMWLHFGDVRIQTASLTTGLVMRQVGNPDLVKEELLGMITAASRR